MYAEFLHLWDWISTLSTLMRCYLIWSHPFSFLVFRSLIYFNVISCFDDLSNVDQGSNLHDVDKEWFKISVLRLKLNMDYLLINDKLERTRLRLSGINIINTWPIKLNIQERTRLKLFLQLNSLLRGCWLIRLLLKTT